jgi:hypothetical protein
MYHPYFRGKQNELITIRELASMMATAGFRPIIEPVKEGLGKGPSGLEKALRAVSESRGRAIVVVNPHHGELSGTAALTEMLKSTLDLPGISAGILLEPSTTLDAATEYYKTHIAHTPVFVHAGFTGAKALAAQLGSPTKAQSHIFFSAGGKLYQKHFKDTYRVLLRDGFNRQRRNSDYPFVEPFSDLHVTYPDEGMDGFGDFLIVGDDYSESGGPAYAVAIHLTFIDPDQDDSMLIYHFKSTRRDTQKDPAGKFKEALAEMINTLDAPGSKVLETNAVGEFRRLHQKGHFPGLGYVKKLSMSHHIETLADYFNNAA